MSLPSPVRATAITLLTAVTLAGCSTTSSNTEPAPTDPVQSEAAPEENAAPEEALAPESSISYATSVLPPETTPEPPQGRSGWEECPYLDAQWVETTNGQRVTGIGTDQRFETPACVFWSYPEAPQLQVIVRHMPTEDEATAVVDHFAAVDTTNPAELPGGWMGGRAGGTPTAGETGAVFAVSRGQDAVVVLTNQDQSLKAQLVAEETIANLGL